MIELRKERDFIRGEIKKDTVKIIKDSFKKYFTNPITIYRDILKRLNLDSDFNLSTEDLTPILYINYKIYGNANYTKYKHIVIDEAQDYSDLTFYTLKTLMRNATFSIYGDLAQSLYPNKSIISWESVKHYTFNDNIKIKYLSKSYRTSIEIMNEANKINSHLNLTLATPVIRHGENVKYVKYNTNNDIKEHLLELIKKYKSIGIISKEELKAKEIYDYLIKNNIEINYIDENNNEYSGGICSLTGTLSKGLEFDAVIITDADNRVYNIDNNLDMKVLYVSMTRALHELIVMYSDVLTEVL